MSVVTQSDCPAKNDEMKLNKDYVSVKFRYFSFAAMIAVIMIHCGFDSKLCYSVSFVTLWAVPWFAFAAGVFFRPNVEKTSLLCYAKRRFYGVFVPYLIWVAFGLMIWVSRAHLMDNPIALSLNHASWWVGLLGGVPVVNPPMWFLRSLFCFSLLLAVIHKVAEKLIKIKRARVATVVITYSVLVLYCEYLKMGFIYGTYTTPFYFLCGYFVSDMLLKNNMLLKGRDSLLTAVVAFFIYILMTMLRIYFRNGGISSSVEIIIRNGAVVSFLVFAWMAYDVLFCKRQMSANEVVCMNFFPFLIHYPIIDTAYRLIGKQLGGELFYVIASLISVAGFISLGIFLKRKTPALFAALTGGR